MRPITLLPIILALALLILSCSEENPPTGPEGWQELTSPFNTLWDVRYCFNHFEETDMSKWFATLVSDDFVFYFDPDDIGDNVGEYTIPAFWTKDEFVNAVRNLFKQAYSITLNIPVLEQGEEVFGKPAEGDTTFLKSNVTINLIVMVNEETGYQAQGFCDFRFSKGSDGLWRLCEWRDHTSSQLLSIQPASLGEILAMFY
jgi:hypothetical protein